jgi:CheY-like chemotaxis protein
MNNFEILLIEDDLIEKMKFERVLNGLGYDVDLVIRDNGQKGIDYLEEGNSPSVILLDLNMPEMNGIEFLSYVFENENLRHFPVMILTTSENTQDLKKCFSLGIAGYVLKPLKYEDYELTIKKIVDYWMINQLIK